MGVESTNAKISKAYEDRSGFVSMAQTIKDDETYYPEINKAGVEKWYKANVKRSVVQKNGYNSYVAKEPLEEFQIDLFNMRIKEDDEYKMAISAIDIFTKVATVMAIPNKQPETFLKALKQIFPKMGNQE